MRSNVRLRSSDATLFTNCAASSVDSSTKLNVRNSGAGVDPTVETTRPDRVVRKPAASAVCRRITTSAASASLSTSSGPDNSTIC